MKDWTGNNKSIYTSLLGASNHSLENRESHDYYATHPETSDYLLEIENFDDSIWECAAGENHLTNRLRAHDKQVIATDLIDRGIPDITSGVDF
jgi:hypothetical protein